MQRPEQNQLEQLLSTAIEENEIVYIFNTPKTSYSKVKFL